MTSQTNHFIHQQDNKSPLDILKNVMHEVKLTERSLKNVNGIKIISKCVNIYALNYV